MGVGDVTPNTITGSTSSRVPSNGKKLVFWTPNMTSEVGLVAVTVVSSYSPKQPPRGVPPTVLVPRTPNWRLVIVILPPGLITR